MSMREKIPVWKKVNLSIEEAAAYSNIGEAKIRELAKLPDCNFVLMKGTVTLIKSLQDRKSVV